jgi:hypothetical protein
MAMPVVLGRGNGGPQLGRLGFDANILRVKSEPDLEVEAAHEFQNVQFNFRKGETTTRNQSRMNGKSRDLAVQVKTNTNRIHPHDW